MGLAQRLGVKEGVIRPDGTHVADGFNTLHRLCNGDDPFEGERRGAGAGAGGGGSGGGSSVLPRNELQGLLATAISTLGGTYTSNLSSGVSDESGVVTASLDRADNSGAIVVMVDAGCGELLESAEVPGGAGQRYFGCA